MQRFANWTNLSETTFVLPPSGRGCRLPGAHLHAGARAALRRAPDARHLPRLAGGRRHAAAARRRSCNSAPPGWCRCAATADGLAFAAPPLVRSGAVEEALRRAHRRRAAHRARATILAARVGRQRARLGGGAARAAPTRCCRATAASSISTWACWAVPARFAQARSRCARSFPRTAPPPRTR